MRLGWEELLFRPRCLQGDTGMGNVYTGLPCFLLLTPDYNTPHSKVEEEHLLGGPQALPPTSSSRREVHLELY